MNTGSLFYIFYSNWEAQNIQQIPATTYVSIIKEKENFCIVLHGYMMKMCYACNFCYKGVSF